MQLAGRTLVIVSLGYLAILAWSQRHAFNNWELSPEFIFAFILSSVIYCAAGVCIAIAWKLTIRRFDPDVVPRSSMLEVYTSTQLAKYLPGNVAHIAGRHMAARAQGYSHSGLILATLYELLGILSVVGIISGIALGAFSERNLIAHPNLYFVPLLGCLLPAFATAHKFFPQLFNSLRLHTLPVNVGLPKLLTFLYLIYGAFFVLAGWSLLILCYASLNSASIGDTTYIIFAFSLAWVLGYLTPGAPSGLGVREIALVYLLSSSMTESDAVILAAIFRLSTFAGDILLWLVTRFLTSRQRVAL
ncbi:MAG: flippase-like domain-containing protein [Halioglobus sp.]|nr:flippase-like domain-containing protein [Halioglobus sp.]